MRSDDVKTSVGCLSRRRFALLCQIGLVSTVWPVMKLLGAAVDYAVAHLHANPPFPEGASTGSHDVGVTALVTTALLRNGQDVRLPAIVRSLKYLENSVQTDGGIYTPGRELENYETCLAMTCINAANLDRRYDHLLENALTFLKTCQWDERRGRNLSDRSYGGVGYGKQKQPDLANTALWLNAVGFDGAHQEESFVKKALLFVSRCQNIAHIDHKGEPAHDGGFHDVADAEDSGSLSGSAAIERPSSWVMTMYGLKGLLLAGVDRNDARVQAAVQWIRNDYHGKSNPGLNDVGLYRYYHVCAEALNLLGMEVIEDSSGVRHHWRNELCAEILGRQREDGSWLNENEGRWEDDPQIATAYALLALSYCKSSMTPPVKHI